MGKTDLLDHYKELVPQLQKVFVIPLIKFETKETDYLYQLYKSIINNIAEHNVVVESLSIFYLPLIFFNKLFNNKIIVHQHWFEFQDGKSAFGILWKLFWLTLYKLIGGKLIWTVHNIHPHNSKWLTANNFARRYIAMLANRLHVHCANAIEIMAPILHQKPEKFFVHEHPNFETQPVNRSRSIELFNRVFDPTKLDENKKYFLMFGQVAEYKGILECAEMFSHLDKNNVLLIIGETKKGNEEYSEKIISYSDKEENVIFMNESIPSDRVYMIFNSIDFALFNFSQILTSGSVQLAIDYNCNIIIPDMGCLKEIHYSKKNIFNSDDELKNILKSIR